MAEIQETMEKEHYGQFPVSGPCHDEQGKKEGSQVQCIVCSVLNYQAPVHQVDSYNAAEHSNEDDPRHVEQNDRCESCLCNHPHYRDEMGEGQHGECEILDA